MNNPIVKVLRFLIFFPICFAVMAIVNYCLAHLFVWFMSLSSLWFFVILIFLGGTIWALFKWLASVLVMLAAYISPVKWLSTGTITVLALINGAYLGYAIWTIKDGYSGWEIFGAIIGTLLIMELTFALIYGSLVIDSEEN